MGSPSLLSFWCALNTYLFAQSLPDSVKRRCELPEVAWRIRQNRNPLKLYINRGLFLLRGFKKIQMQQKKMSRMFCFSFINFCFKVIFSVIFRARQETDLKCDLRWLHHLDSITFWAVQITTWKERNIVCVLFCLHFLLEKCKCDFCRRYYKNGENEIWNPLTAVTYSTAVKGFQISLSKWKEEGVAAFCFLNLTLIYLREQS